MRYGELIQFDPIDEIIKFSQLGDDDYRAKLVKTFVCSKAYEDHIIRQICAQLDLGSSVETKGIQIVGNYGTGKSHLMSLFSIIAEDASYLPMLQSEKAKEWLKTIAGKYKVYRFELGNNQELWDIVTYKIDLALEKWGVNYRISEDKSNKAYSEKLAAMMAEFEEVYPDKGFLLVIDEMLEYLKGRSDSAKLNRDLAVLRALGEMSDRKHFKMVFGSQELIYRSPEFQHVREMLSHVNERYVDLTIQKEDVQFIAQQRLLQKNEHQKSVIRQHLSKFVTMFPTINNNIDTFVNLFPVHPSYFDNFSLIRIGKSQREVLKTLSKKFKSMMDFEVPTNEPGLICYDSYWGDMKNNVDLMADPDVRKVCDVTNIIDQKIEENFIKGYAPKKALAHRIVDAAAIKILQADLGKANGVTAEALTNDLCHVDSTCESFDDLVDLAMTNTLDNIVKATIGQFFEKGDNKDYHIRIEGGVNYEQTVKNYAAQMSDNQKDEYFFKFLSEVLPVNGETYRTGFRIWSHEIEWQSHKCHRAGYIFMGNPNDRSTTQPQQHFYIYFMPIFNDSMKTHVSANDSVFFLMDELSDDFKQKVVLFGSSFSQEESASTDEKPRYRQLREKYFKEARDLFNNQFLAKTAVEYMDEKHPLAGMPGAQADSKIDTVNQVASFILEKQFENENRDYPAFTMLSQPFAISGSGRDNLLTAARKKISNPNEINRNGEAILMGLGLWENGRLSTKNSQYARSLKQKLDAKNGMVLNRDEILELFYQDNNEYISSDFHIEADLEMLVMGVMAALGEIEIVLRGGGRINASNIQDINKVLSQDNYMFSNICPPKCLNIALVRELMIGLLGVDRTSELDDTNSSVFANLVDNAHKMESRIVSLQHDLQNGVMLSDIEIISAKDANSLNNTFDMLRGICNKMQNYNTKAKMRNIDWPIDTVTEAMTNTKQKVAETEQLLEEIKSFSSLVSYLKMAIGVADSTMRSDIENLLSNLADAFSGDNSKRNICKNELETAKVKYADWYLAEYLKYHLSEIEYQRKQEIMNSDKKTVCDDVKDASFVNSIKYEEWLRKANSLQMANQKADRKYLMTTPTIDGFNPSSQRSALPTIGELKDELADIYNGFCQQFSEAIDDPMAKKNMYLLDQTETETLNQFKSGVIKLDHQHAVLLVKIINKLQKQIRKIEITHDDIMKVFGKPMTCEQAKDAWNEYINSRIKGEKIDEIRIIVK